MFREIFIFELKYRRGRETSYIYFGIVFLLSFLVATSPTMQLSGAVKANSPYVISLLTVALTLILAMIISAVMGVVIIRDFEHNMEAILFSTPIRKIDYVLGRFAGAYVSLLIIFSAIWLGLISGYAVGEYLPWHAVWKGKEMLKFTAWNFFQPFLLFGLTNLYITGALFFMSGTLGRNTIVIYTQGVLLIILYQIGITFLNNLNYQYVSAMIDPFGVQTFQYITKYWTAAEKNTQLVPLEGLMLYNRLLWMSVATLALVITYFGFSFNVVRNLFGLRTQTAAVTSTKLLTDQVALPLIHRVFDSATYFRQLVRITVLYFRMIWKEIPFIAIIAGGMLLLLVNALNMNDLYGTSSYPTTFAVLRLLANFRLPFLIIAIFYSGELVWKERSVNFNQILDAMPVPSFANLLSKFAALMLTYVVLLLILIFGGVLVQVAYGYYQFNFPVYFGTLYTETLSELALYTFLAIFIQVLVNNKFLGFVLCTIFYIARGLLTQLGFEHALWQFASGTLGIFSDMNGYGHFIAPFTWLRLYWLGLSSVLFAAAAVLSVRGADVLIRKRWKTGKLRLTRPLLIFTLMMMILFVFSGSYIYYNTSIINKFEYTKEISDRQAKYEKTLKKYESLLQPKIVESNIAVTLFPALRNFTAEGYYYLKNKTGQAIKDIHVRLNEDQQLVMDYVRFDRKAGIKEGHEDLRYFIYTLAQPLSPGDSIKMNFKVSFITRGFVVQGSSTAIVFNGTFFTNAYFPSLGYDKNIELTDEDVRRNEGLGEKGPMLEAVDLRGRSSNMFGDDADRIRFEMVISTDEDQLAIAPGHLEKEWRAGGRRFFDYKSYGRMSNFYSIVSARYARAQDAWNNVPLEIFYYPAHVYNLERMMAGMKDALAYYSKNFSPFQYKQIRITEFPRYSPIAQSFANTIPFSEGIGFILKSRDPKKDLDMVYYVTAHEIAHQWWGHQVMAADVKGNQMLTEGMAQYSALMVMKHAFSEETIEQYLKYELDSYLRGRAQERKKEPPLQSVEGQSYLYYNKASLLFYALQDYIGEDSLNAAFRRYNSEWASKDAPYPTTIDLLRQIRRVVPDTLKYLITDMFERITLFENKAVDAIYLEKSKNKFEVTLTVTCEKINSDSVGVETTRPIDDWIDVGVYGSDDKGLDKLIYLKKYKINKQENKFIIVVNEKPVKAGIDPLHKLIDRHSNDNTIPARRFIDIGNIDIE